MNLKKTKIFPNNSNKSKEPIRQRVFIPHIEAIIEGYQKHFGIKARKEEIAYIREIIRLYFEQRIEKTFVYKSENIGASFVYNITDTTDLSKRLSYKFNENIKHESDASGLRKKVKEFIFVGGFYNTKTGNEYSSQEEALHKLIMALPMALQNICEMKEPHQREIYTLASPTNELGSISGKFSESLNDRNASTQFGLLFAELISLIISKEATMGNPVDILFYGISMGAGFAIEAAKKLIADGIVTQSHSEKSLPFLQIQINIPPGQSNASKKSRKWQIPIGFALQIISSLINYRYIRKVMFGDKKFIRAKNTVLAENGISVNSSPEEVKLKKDVISKTLANLNIGVPVPNNLKITEVIGIYDPLMYNCKFNASIKKQRQKFIGREKIEGESLGENLTNYYKSPNRRTFGLATNHNIPFLRKSEFQRLKKAANAIRALRNVEKKA